MDNHVKKGVFLGYTATSSQIQYWVMDTNLVNNSNYVRFDEVMNYINIPNTNSIHMQITLGRQMLEDK